MSTAKGYSIWLIPSEEIHDELSGLLHRLSQQFNSPIFEPHITLIPGIEEPIEIIKRKTKQLANNCGYFTIEFSNFGFSDEYFKSLYLNVKYSEELFRAYDEANKIFDRLNSPPFHPHLSLFYGNMNQNEKDKIILENRNLLDISFEVKQLNLYSTKGFSSDWFRIDHSELKTKT